MVLCSRKNIEVSFYLKATFFMVLLRPKTLNRVQN